MDSKVWNIRHTSTPQDALYIGRKGKGQSGTWGNPFEMNSPLTAQEISKINSRLNVAFNWLIPGARLDREQVIELHSHYLVWAILNNHLDGRELLIKTNRGWHTKDLVCFCAPAACHGDTLLKFATRLADAMNSGTDYSAAAERSAFGVSSIAGRI